MKTNIQPTCVLYSSGEIGKSFFRYHINKSFNKAIKIDRAVTNILELL